MHRIFVIIPLFLVGCSFNPELVCNKQTKAFPPGEISRQFYGLSESSDPSHIAAVLSDVAANCNIPDSAEDKFIAALEKVGKIGERNLIIDLYKSLQDGDQKFRAALISASNNFRQEQIESVIGGEYKLIDVANLGNPFYELPEKFKTTKVMEAINSELQNEDIRVVRTAKRNDLVVVQREELQGASGGSDSLSLIFIDGSSSTERKELEDKNPIESMPFGAWGTGGQRIGKLVVSKDGRLIGVVSAERVDAKPTTNASNAALGCHVISAFYPIGAQTFQLPLKNQSSCDGTEKIFAGQDFDLAKMFGWISQAKERIGLANLIKYSRMDSSDKLLLKYFAANKESSASEIYEDLRSRLPVPGKEMTLEQLKRFVGQLNEWRQGISNVKEAFGLRIDPSATSILTTIGKLKDDISTLPDFQKVDEELNKYNQYSLMVYRQMPGSLTLNGRSYSYVYETLINGMYPVTKGIRLVVGDSAVFSGQGLLSVKGVEIGTTSFRLNENLGGFVVDVPVIAAMSKEDEERGSALRKQRNVTREFMSRLNDAYTQADRLNSRLEND